VRTHRLTRLGALQGALRGALAAATVAGTALLPSGAPAALALPAAPPGAIATVAGMGLSNGDGRAATSATLNLPFGQGVTDIAGHPRAGIAVDTRGNLYISDRSNHRVRKVAPGPDGTLRTGTISTVAGTGASGFSGDGGRAAQAKLNSPAGISVDP
jgi:NHL repeat